MTTRRGGSSSAAAGTAVLDAPVERYASGETVTTSARRGPGPAPAGALQRGYPAQTQDDEFEYNRRESDDYEPRRGRVRPSLRGMVRGLLRSTAGRVVLGVLSLGLLGGVAVGALLGWQYLLHDARFVVTGSSAIETGGNAHLTRAQVLSVFGGDLQRNIFRVPLAQRQAELENLPWVEHATVMRLLPDRLRVRIVERVPVAFARQGTRIGLVDAHGVLLDMDSDAATDARYSFPVLTGIEANNPLSVRAARMQIYSKFMQALDGTGQRLSKTVSEVDVSDPEDVKALIASADAAGAREVLVHFGDERYLERYNEFAKHLPEWRQQYPKLASADMRYPGQIVLEMAKETVGSGEKTVEGAAAGPPAVPPAPKPVALPVTAKPAVAVHTSAESRKSVPPVTPKAVAQPVKTMPQVKKIVAKPVVAKVAVKPKNDGSSAANERMFAALAAQRKAAESRGSTP